MTRHMTCILCPHGCSLTVANGENGLSVTGNTCSRGKKYAISECTHPVRTVTATVRVANRKDTMLAVKTEAPVPKEEMFTVMTLLRNTKVNAPLAIGDVILKDVLGTQIVATAKVD